MPSHSKRAGSQYRVEDGRMTRRNGHGEDRENGERHPDEGESERERERGREGGGRDRATSGEIQSRGRECANAIGRTPDRATAISFL